MGASFIARRLGALAATLLAASFLIYVSLYLSPGDPAAVFAGSGRLSPEALAAIHKELRLDDPVLVSYWRWLSGAVQGDFGTSIVYRESVTTLMEGRVVNTVFLIVYAGLLVMGLGLTLGVLSALKPGKVADAITALTAVSMAAPVFVVAVVLVAFFSVKLGWFPVFGGGSGFVDRLWHLTLPAIALALSFVAYITQVTAAAIRGELRSEHVDTARARGIPERLVIRRHVLRNATGAVLSLSGITVAGLMAGVVIAEQAFGVNGLGALLVDAAQKKDFAVVQAIALIMVAVVVVANTALDLIGAKADPRIARRLSR